LKRYILQRLLLLIPLLLGVSLVTFILAHLVPGDPISSQFGLNPRGMEPETVERLRGELGLDDPLPVQYLRYLRQLLRGDLGRSLATRAPVSQEILARLPATLELAAAALLLVLVVAIPLGVLSAAKRGSALDQASMLGAVLGVSVPSFWLGIMLMLLFALNLELLPSSGRGDGSLWAALKSLILPAVTLAAGLVGLVARVTRSSMLEVLGQDHVRTAYAKGLPPKLVVVRHGLRNALIPVVTILGLQSAALLGGTVIVETVFAWPGIGRLAVNAIWRRDYPVIMGTVLVFSLIFVLANLAADILYTLLDPRIRYD
jgi:peptide/nickel transport system permease protein